MPPRSKVLLLPDEVRQELNARLIKSAFSGYVELSEWLGAQGFEIKKSALHEYGSAFEDKLGKLALATQQARAIVAESPDDEGAMSEALMRLVQDKIFGILMEIEVDPKDVNISSITRSVAELSRACVTQKKYLQDVRERAAAAADAATSIAKKGGLTANSVAEIRSAILGIPQ